jgi:raffinose/stachyose/melibiose transport system substrate-binding protein
LIEPAFAVLNISISLTVISTVASAEITINLPSIWVGKDSKTTVISELVDEFNTANAGAIKVVIEEQTDYDIYAQKLTAQLSTGTLPDIFTVGADLLDILHRSGKAMDFAPHVSSDSHWNNVYPEGALKSNMMDGQLNYLPYELFVVPVTYNKKLLKAAGYDEFPDNYDDFFKMCEAVTATGVACTSQMTAKNAWTSMLWFSQALASAGGPDIYENGLDDPAFVKAFEVMEKMYQYTTSDAIGADAGVSGGHFLNERTAVFMNGPWFIARYTSDGIPGAPSPPVSIGAGATPMSACNPGIPSEV